MTTFPFEPQHPFPALAWNQGDDKPAYYRIPNDWRVRDAHLDALTNTGSVIAAWVRLLAGRRSDGTYSRTPESAITLDTLSLGIDHRWARYLPERFAEIARRCPELAAWAWGDDGARLLLDEAWLSKWLGDVKGKHPRELWPGRSWECLEWLVAGWHEIARHPHVLRIWIEGTTSKLRDALELCEEQGWMPTAEVVALCARASNSYGSSGFKRRILAYAGDYPKLAHEPLDLIRAFYDDPEQYDQDDRDDLIVSMFDESVVSADDLDADELNWGAPVVRFDGTVPKWREALTWRMV